MKSHTLSSSSEDITVSIEYTKKCDFPLTNIAIKLPLRGILRASSLQIPSEGEDNSSVEYNVKDNTLSWRIPTLLQRDTTGKEGIFLYKIKPYDCISSGSNITDRYGIWRIGRLEFTLSSGDEVDIKNLSYYPIEVAATAPDTTLGGTIVRYLFPILSIHLLSIDPPSIFYLLSIPDLIYLHINSSSFRLA